MELKWDVLNVQIVDQLKKVFVDSLENIETSLILDLNNVNKIDLCAIQLFLSLKKTLEAREQKLLFANCTNSVLDAFALCGCLELLEFADE